MQFLPPLPQYHPSFHKTESCFRSRQLALSLSPRRCSRARRVSGRTSSGTNHGSTPMAVGIFCNARSCRAVRALSYPETSGFPECRAIQVSPQAPAASLRPHQPCSAEPVPLLPYGPGARLPLAFTHVRSESARAVGRFLVAQHLQRFAGGQSGSNGALQLRAPVATWRALLEAPRYGGNWIHVGDVDPIGLADRCALSGVCIRQLGGLHDGVCRTDKPHGADRRACVLARGSARDYRMSFVTYSESRFKNMEHQEVSALPTGRCVI